MKKVFTWQFRFALHIWAWRSHFAPRTLGYGGLLGTGGKLEANNVYRSKNLSGPLRSESYIFTLQRY